MKAFFTSLVLLLILSVNIKSFAFEIYEVTSDVFVRSGIGTSNEPLGVAKAGAQVNVLDKSNPNWYKIEFEDKVGYISSKFVKLVEPIIADSVEEVPIVDVEEQKSYPFAGVLILFFALFIIIEISRRYRKKRIASSIQKFQGAHPELFQEPKNIKVANDNRGQIKRLTTQKGANPVTLITDKRKTSGETIFGLKDKPIQTVHSDKKPNVITQAPYWPDRDVFNLNVIDKATNEQKLFYQYFKEKFKANSFLDLNGNNNYAFVLLHDLLAEYENHQNIGLLETQLFNLGAYYSKTKSYAIGYLKSIKREIDGASNEEISSELIASQNFSLEDSKEDESIIDVTMGPFTADLIPQKSDPIPVPTWAHQYVYSKSDLNSANSEQKIFYNHFKQKFLNGTSLDIMGNTNYAFVLLFDLLDEYRNHLNINLLDSQINSLGNSYYKTRSYGIRFLNDIKKELGIQSGFAGNFTNQKIEIKPADEVFYDSEPDYVYWKVGSKYKEKLGLNDKEVVLLNKLWESTTNFCSIEFCYFQVIQLYLDSIAIFAEQCEKSGSNLENEFLIASDLIARKIFRYRKGSANYKMSVKNTSDEFYTTLFKLCENAVREHYGHRRKLSTEIRYSDPLISEQFEAKIAIPFSHVIGELVIKIPEPDEATQKELNALNTSRWKDEFQRICDTFSGNEKKFLEDIKSLGDVNAKNPSIENIFFEASKFMATKDKESSLILYMHYLDHDLKSAKFDNKKLTKTIQKSLFKSQEQLDMFGVIVNDFLKYQNLDKAISAVSELYAIKRKRIKLDRNSIEEVRQQHAGTVQLLNEFLQDEEEDIKMETTDMSSTKEEIEIHITSVKGEVSESPFLEEIELKPIHYSALELFSKNNFSIPVSEIESFAKANGVFRNQLIESINEACYEVLDDILIEEDEDFYIIEAMYFQTITTK
ncbi:tellurite resistance TerB C-terminal domain-containing protein [Algoriphagus sp. Y33]|uniref:tellurite resistance TerB C-terminal domain-containing protein n=1 Tax=Algoriphagus sp. Y33 TaxID=2772483 RepID=UPI00177E20B4|nr:tellurite resistance TerB C-terminal domain-containing protein [Algoriphagus sp. Y33]